MCSFSENFSETYTVSSSLIKYISLLLLENIGTTLADGNRVYVEGDILTPPSLLSQPLWVTCPATPEASPTWPRWILTCLSMSAPACVSPPASCRLFHSVQVWGGLWSTSPHCAPCSLSAPGCCTARARPPERWCSGFWQKRSRTCGCSTTLQVRNCVFQLVPFKSACDWNWIDWVPPRGGWFGQKI